MKSFLKNRVNPILQLIIFVSLFFSILATNNVYNNFKTLKSHFQTSPSSKGPYYFTLTKPEPVHFEIDYTMAKDENSQNAIILKINGIWDKIIQTRSSSYNERIRFTIPQSKFKSGKNQLAIEFKSGQYPVFSLDVRLTNYLGISPNFPKGYVISDAWPENQLGFQRITVMAGNFIVVLLFGFISFFAILKIANLILPSSSWNKPGKAILLLIIPTLIPAITNLYSMATPVKVVFPFASLMGVCLIYFFLATGVLLIARWKKFTYPVIMVVSVTLGVAEISLRLFNLLNPSHIFYNKSYDRYRGQSSSYYNGFLLNSKGFHDIEHPMKKPENSFRIVALGDSFAFGVVPYQHNFLTLLEDKLKQDHPANEVVNLGIGATGVRTHLSVLANEGLNYNPDMVITTFFIGNDFEVPRKKIYEHSFLATLINYTYQYSRYYAQQLRQPKALSSPALNSKEQPNPAPASNYRDDHPSFPPDIFMGIEANRSVVFRKDYTKFSGLGERAFYYLREIRDLCLKKGIEFKVVIIPDEAQVNSSLQRNVIQAHGIGPDGFDFLRPNKWLANRLSQADISSIDLTEYFIKHSEGTRLYKPQDTHWNIAGNKLAADILYKNLSSSINANSESGK